MEINAKEKEFRKSKYLSSENVEFIVSKHGVANGYSVEDYYIQNASDKMLGFLCDYWKLKVQLTPNKRVLHYFLKLVSVSNDAKAKMVKELQLFENELYFYTEIKERIHVSDLKPWSAPFITGLKSAMVFEDMNALQYKLRDKFKRFDEAHTFEALKTLTRFHASSIIYEEKRSKELGRSYSLNEDFEEYLNKGGYENKDTWFSQCRNGCLKAIKNFSNYSKTEISVIESLWFDVWSAAVAQTDPSPEYRNVICHRDLWNNNLMFHYQDENKPDDCVLVDFQAVRYHPPSGDVMFLLYCNLDPKYREENMKKFLNFYIEELHRILVDNGIDPNVITKEKFFESAELQRQWGLITCACLIPQFWIDDEVITNIFTDTVQFDNNLRKDKASFITKMMESNPDYKEKVMEIFEEIVDRYCL
ncbi:putative Juvenile hormone-inducible protein [Operophtera brumata]|uniref:Putative Juvenile hormone-inducible protein n=1 Tax=Operophtera brumata TaxID=104452 RepID=A0A0L7LBN0_OPEBR|nr:putative Juvenile hormone-inducible protein [Operophtera brumata]